MFKFLTKRRRTLLKKVPFKDEWRKILKTMMPLYNKLPDIDKTELENHTKVLIAEKKFIGANNLVLTEEMRVLICAQAAVLLLHRQHDYFPNVDTIVIYSSSFVSNLNQDIGGGAYIEAPVARIGESNARAGIVVLAWDSVRLGAKHAADGQNVVLHEFAHQLDSEDGVVNGAPILNSCSSYREWASVMSAEYAHMLEQISHHHKTFINEYGATNPAEFFAVLTELFFEKPVNLKKHNEDLYDLLVKFYCQNPIDYI